MPKTAYLRRLAAWAAVALLYAPWVLAGQADAGPTCPLASPQSLASGLAAAAVTREMRRGDGVELASESTGPYDAQAAAARREAERQTFERLLATRPALSTQAAFEVAITPRQREAIEHEESGNRLRVGTALPIDAPIDFSRLETPADMRGEFAFAGGILRVDSSETVWEAEVASEQASALRLRFRGVELATGVELYVYNEAGRVAGPYTGKGPDGSGDFWSHSVFGERVRVHLRAPDPAALRASRFDLAQAMHFGSRYRIADAVRQNYSVGPEPNGGFCGTIVASCTVDGMCALQTNEGLENATNAIAHLQFPDGDDAFICTGTLLNTTFEGTEAGAGNAAGRPPYLLTANHCVDNPTSAANMEAYFRYHTAACNGACSWSLVEVDGATLLTTGALPTYSDFSLLQLSPLPVGAGLVRLGWSSESVLSGWYLLHLSHPNGAPLAYSHRRARVNNPNLPHCEGAPEPNFLYSGLSAQTSDASGAVGSGSSGAAALVLLDDASDVRVVGQLLGHCPNTGDVCDANTDATLDGSFRASFPYLKRFLVDRIYADGFD